MSACAPLRAHAEARQRAAFDAARVLTRAAFADAWQVAESRAAAGLVSVSTSVPDGLSVVGHMAENTICIDRPMQRVTNLRKQVGVGAKLLHNMATGPENMVMVTLTYRGDNRDWKPHHISDYIRKVRKWHDKQFRVRAAWWTSAKLRYVWVAELQDRGVIHYHCIFWLARNLLLPKADKAGWWPHGMTKTEKAEKPIGYLMSYVSKIETKNVGGFPRGARIYAVGGLDRSGSDIRRWVRWPAYLQGNSAVGEPWRPAQGGGYANASTGEVLAAEFAPTGGGFTRFIRVRTHPRRIDPAGPFSWLPESPTVH